MAAASLDITIEKGAKFIKTLSYQDSSRVPISLSPYAARMQIRQSIDAASYEVEVTTSNGGIILEKDGQTGRIDISIGATVTDTITFSSGIYDLELYDPVNADDVIRLVEGAVIISENVTR